MRRVAVLCVSLVALAWAPSAFGVTIVKRDLEGRAIRFDVRAPGIDTEWYAELLRQVAHGNEISRVTFRLVSWDVVRSTCGAGAAACYTTRGRTPLIVVPAGKGKHVAHALIHEYAHHLDDWRGVRGAREPNGTPGWWEARGMERLLAARRVARDYSRGWNRGIAEIFAEDFTQLHLVTEYGIGWLGAPDERVLAALRRDLPNAPVEPIDLEGVPSVSVRSGTLRRGTPVVVPFGLLGPGRRVTFTVRLPDAARAGFRARIELRCGSVTATRLVPARARTATLDRPSLGPAARCTMTLRGATASPQRFIAVLRLAIETPPPSSPPTL